MFTLKTFILFIRATFVIFAISYFISKSAKLLLFLLEYLLLTTPIRMSSCGRTILTTYCVGKHVACGPRVFDNKTSIIQG